MPVKRLLPLILFTAACTAPEPSEPLPLLGGYRAPADQCQRVGENAATVEYLDDAADLVACPAGAENIGVFVADTGATYVGELPGWELYSVPLR